MDLNNTNKVLKSFEEKITSKAKKNLSGSKSSGKLASSFKVSVETSKGSLDINVTMEDYGEFVDEGRKPGKGIPVNDLKQWIKKKRLTTDGPMTETKLNSLAYVINKKIREEGIAPTNFLTNPIEALINLFANDIASAYGDDVVDDMFSDKITLTK